jgi:hypothetical protein
MYRQRAFVRLVMMLILIAVAGCTSTGPADKAGNAPSPTPTPSRYASTAFVVPLEVTAPSWLGPTEIIDGTDFLSWAPTVSQRPAVRFLVPLNLYRPGSHTAEPAPDDYLSYLLSLAKYGVRFGDQRRFDIDGHAATLLTLTADQQYNGALGCYLDRQPAAECLGLQLQPSLRMAVLKVNGHNLLIWLRQAADTEPADAAARIALFEEMLRGIRFRSVAPPSSSPTQ